MTSGVRTMTRLETRLIRLEARCPPVTLDGLTVDEMALALDRMSTAQADLVLRQMSDAALSRALDELRVTEGEA